MTRAWVRRLPAWVRTQPMDVMFAILGIPSGLAGLSGVARSRALDQVLPEWAVRLWAVCLLVGCVAWLTGLMSVKAHDGRMVVTRLPILLLGLQLLSTATLVFFVAIIAVGGWGGVLAGWPLLVASAATYVRRADLIDRQRGHT